MSTSPYWCVPVFGKNSLLMDGNARHQKKLLLEKILVVEARHLVNGFAQLLRNVADLNCRNYSLQFE